MQQSQSKTETALSKIAAQTMEAMKPVVANGTGKAVATFTFGEGFAGFQGHFPDKPVLPGVCQIECVLSLFSHWREARAKLVEIVSAKYVLPILPGEEVTCNISNVKEAGDDIISLSASLLKGKERVSTLRLKVRLMPPESR